MAERSRTALFDLTTLAICFMGFVSLITLVLQLKSGIRGVPRVLFLLFLAMACAPFLSALWRTPKPVFLIAPVVALFFLYPIAAPHGIVFGRDPIYNFDFAETVARSGFWRPGSYGGLADAYSLYPLGNVFMAWITRTASLPGEVAFLWIQPMLRLLAIPTVVYAIGHRIFGPRIAAFGVFLYLGTGSILFNVPVQQGIGVIFFALALLSLLMMVQNPTPVGKRRTQLLFALVATGIVMTHHLSSYIFAGWIAALVVVTASQRRTKLLPLLGILTVYFVVLLALYIATVSYRVYIIHEQSFEVILQRLISPESIPIGGAPGRTFTLGEIAWLGSSVLVLIVLALIAVRAYRPSDRHALACANAFIGACLVLVTLPLLPTGAEFVPLRIGEYSNLFVAPFAAATLLRWSRPGLGRWARFVPAAKRVATKFPPAAVLVLSALLFMGGNLVPYTLRPYFEDTSQWNTDTPLLFGADAARMAAWGRGHYDEAHVWGDHLAIDIFSGFGDMRVEYGGSRVFLDPTLSEGVWCPPGGREDGCLLFVGDYVAVSHRMVVYPSQFFLEPEPPVRAPLSEAQIGKFARDPHFSLVFQDGTFSIYRVMSVPPG